MSKNREREINKSIQKSKIARDKKQMTREHARSDQGFRKTVRQQQPTRRTEDLDLEQRRAALRQRKNQSFINLAEEDRVANRVADQVAGIPKAANYIKNSQEPRNPEAPSRGEKGQNQAGSRTRTRETHSTTKNSQPRRRYSTAQRRRREQERRKRLIRHRIGCLGQILVLVLCVVLGISAMKSHFGGSKKQEVQISKHGEEKTVQSKNDKKTDKKTNKKDKKKDNVEATTEGKKEEPEKTVEEIIADADLLAAGYDYKKAIHLIKSIEGYENQEELTKRVDSWEKKKKKLVKFGPEDVTHIFYHTLVVEPKLAFECHPSISTGFKEWMTTVREFNKITQKMYDKGYVLVSLYDFFEESYDADGEPHFKKKNVYLPKGKKPFILSLDDLSYYHTYTGHGMANKLIIGEDGKITCEYTEQDGSVSVGSYDCVPLLNDFMEEHPDGAYRGARGTIALTGYNGVFGYRTDISYVTKENLDEDKAEWLADHPEFDYDKEVEEARKIAEELKAEGWDFASHTWGHIRVGNSSLERIKKDTKKWLKNVKPIIGDTECIIFAHGQDLSSSDRYDTENNEKYKYLKSQGFHIYLNVDSHRKTMEVHDEYVHGGRRNLDGYRLWSDGHGRTNWTSDLFDASEVLDSRRKDVPTPKD